MTEQVTEQTTTEAAQQPAKAAPDLNLNDLTAMRNLIDVVTQRGAFKANELSSVGVLFDKLNAFLEAANQAQQAQQAAVPEQPQGE
jgi:hypothetical protein